MANKTANKTVTVTKLDASDLATILAALRMFQRHYEDYPASDIAQDWPDHFELGEQVLDEDGQVVEWPVKPEPLGSEDIGDLCERLNTADVVEIEVQS